MTDPLLQHARLHRYRPEIDGIRALAVGAVVIYHAFPALGGAGFLGVDVFFVISGYLITLTILRDFAGDRFSLVAFWERRARRILPALFAMLLALCPVALLLFTPVELKGFGTSVGASTLFAANLYFWRSSGGYFALGVDHLPLLNLWSLGVEEQFYLLYPLVFVCLHRLAPRRTWQLLALLGLVSFAACVFASSRAPVANFYLLPTRAWELIAGGLLAFRAIEASAGRRWWRHPDLGAATGLALILASIIVLPATAPLPGWRTVPVILGTLLLIADAGESRLIRPIATAPPVRTIGLASYSIYLWHQPLLAFVRVVSPDLPSPWLIGATLVAAVAIGIASYRWIEQPFRRARQVARLPFVTTMALAAALLIAFAAVTRVTGGLPGRLPPPLRAIAAMPEIYTARLDPCFFAPHVARGLSDGCVVGESGPIRSAIIGDSHAVALAPGIVPLLDRSRTRAILLTGAGCPPVTDPMTVSTLQAHCPGFGRRVQRALLAAPSIRVVVIAARWPYYVERSFFDNGAGGVETGPEDYLPYDPRRTRALRDDLAQLIGALTAAGKTVVLVYPVPEPGWHVPGRIVHSYLLGYRAGMAPSVDAARVDERARRAVTLLDSIPDHALLIRARPRDEVCNRQLRGRCALMIGGQPLYFDDDHPDERGARLMLGGNLTRGGMARGIVERLRANR